MLSSLLPDIDVAGARDDFWDDHRLALLCLAVRLSYVGLMWMS
jgi:hypothetical protein